MRRLNRTEIHQIFGNDRRNWFVMFVAAWELVTLAFPREKYRFLPDWWLPWTRYFYRWRTDRYKRLILWFLLGWLVEHVFGEDRCVHVVVPVSVMSE